MRGRELEGLPPNWALVPLGEVAEVQLGKMLSQKARTGHGARPYLRNVNVRWHHFDLSDLLEMGFSDREMAKYELREGDLLVCEGGEPGRAAVWRGQLPGIMYQKALHRVRPRHDALDPQFLAYQLEYDAGNGRLTTYFTGSTIKHLPREALLLYPVRLPPRDEQDRIVDSLDAQFTRLAAAVAALERVRANLKRYRAAVLKAACEGRLVPTEAELARREGRDYEPADVLLQRILRERRARWEAEELERLKTKGKPPTDDRWKQKYKEPEPPDTNELPSLPEGWTWAPLAALGELKGGITKGFKPRAGEVHREVPYLRVANVQRGYLDLTDVRTIRAPLEKIEALRLQPGDVLFNEGGDRDKLGRGWIWSGEIPECIHQNHVFRARLYLPDLQPKYISWYANSAGQEYFVRQGKQTTNLASINLTKLGSLPVALPPAAEQARIAQEIERRLSLVDSMQTALETAGRRAERLRHAILRCAFTGRLVPQDPNDEAASTLLERIRARRHEQTELAIARSRT